jgi:hypothetical protein
MVGLARDRVNGPFFRHRLANFGMGRVRSSGRFSMSIVIPPFDQYQQPLIPLRGLWNAAPAEGDRFVNCEIDWLVTTKGQAVQFSLSGNSPVALSQIVALAVDNSRSGADVAFVFPDSGSELVVPAHNLGVFPVFTNALMFYAVAAGAAAGDVTIFQVLNSLPPPIPIAVSGAQNLGSLTEAALGNAVVPLIAAPINGTLNTLSISVYVETTTPNAIASIALVDGQGRNLWTQVIVAASGDQNLIFNLSGLALRFRGGVNVVIAESTLTGGLSANVYYSSP